MADFVMPRLGADMEAGTLVEWRKHPGDAVHRGDVIADVETDKGVIAVESFTGGVLEELLIEPGQHVPVGAVLAKIRENGEPAGAVAATPAAIAAAPASPAQTSTSPVPTPPARTAADAPHSSIVAPAHLPASRLAISPSARRLARELGVDPSSVRGTGRGGVIQRVDIERAAKEQPTAKEAAPETPPTPVEPPAQPSAAADRLARMRQTIAAAMSRSKREIPHYYLSTTIDLHRAARWIDEENARRAVTERLLIGALFLKATALALREIPELNALWEEGRAHVRSGIHVGVAIALRGGGLIAPAIHHTDRLSLDQLMLQLRDLTERARSGGLRSSELADATITVTSLGERGVETVFGVIYPPQVAIVGFGKVVERPWADRGGLYARPVVTATLSGDHRATDGHRGGLFLSAIDRLLQEPEEL